MINPKYSMMIAAMNSGGGKTSITYGLIALLKKRGFCVQAFKTGPDYIDPIFHSVISKRPCINLDPYFLEPANGDLKMHDLYSYYASQAEVAITEGAMGYYDGISGEGLRGSAWAVASELSLPVILVVDFGGKKALSLKDDYAGIIKDYIDKYQIDNNIKGILINRLETELSETHNETNTREVTDRIQKVTGIEVIGCMPEIKAADIKSRHLGLVTPDDKYKLIKNAEIVSDSMEQHINYDKLMEISKCLESETQIGIKQKLDVDKDILARFVKHNRFRLALAKDEAFCFIYYENIKILSELGADIVYFSPLHDVKLPDNIDCIWLPGGYPESYADKLSANFSMLVDIKEKIVAGIPTVAECGGFLYLHEQLENINGESYSMCGVLEGRAYKTNKLGHFGYIELEALEDTLLLRKGDRLKSHEFHYWNVLDTGTSAKAEKANKSNAWSCIVSRKNLWAGFPHIYLGSNMQAAKRLVEICAIKSIRNKKDLLKLISCIGGTDKNIVAEAGKRWDSIAKPLHGLGELENIISKIAGIEGSLSISLDKKCVVVMCADNGIVEEGVTQTDKSVTAIVSKNFANGVASVNKMCDSVGADVIAVDIGVASDLNQVSIRNYKTVYGTKNFLKEDAMTEEETVSAIMSGIDIVRRCIESGYKIIGTGEMGIGNTTTAAAVTSVLLNMDPYSVAGRGAGLSKSGILHKADVIKKGIEIRKPDSKNMIDVLKKVGGLDIAGMTGLFIGGAIYKIPIVIDGFISSVSALIAVKLNPYIKDYIIASHLSEEVAAEAVMRELGLNPVIRADLGLGEGTGTTLIFPILEASLKVYNEFKTFRDINIEAYEKFEV